MVEEKRGANWEVGLGEVPVRWAEAVPKTNGGVDVPAAVAEDEPEEAVEERKAGEEAGMVAAEE